MAGYARAVVSRMYVAMAGGESMFNGDCVPDVGLARICL